MPVKSTRIPHPRMMLLPRRVFQLLSVSLIAFLRLLGSRKSNVSKE